jgi:hypothetical protein
MTVATGRTINNDNDVGRTIPSTSLSPRMLTKREGVVTRLLPGTNAAAIALDQAIAPGSTVFVLAFVTASGAPAIKTLLQAPADFTVVESNAAGVGVITPTGDQSLNTLLIHYSPEQPDETIGGQTTVTP